MVAVPGVDLTDPDAVTQALTATAAAPAAPLRAVVNLVGGYGGGAKVHETSPADFEAQFTLNLRPTFLVTRAALPQLLTAGGGSVVCVATKGVVAPYPKAAGYLAAKAAVLTFAQAVAAEYKTDGVRCNALLPSVIDTPANRAAQPSADYSRWVSPDQFASAVLFLAGEESAAITGAAMPLYGKI